MGVLYSGVINEQINPGISFHHSLLYCMCTWIYGTFFLFLVDVVGSFHIVSKSRPRHEQKQKWKKKREANDFWTEQIGGVCVYVHGTAKRKI